MIIRKSVTFNYFVQNKFHFRFKYKWIEPTGYNTNIMVYNELVKNKVPLIFPNKDFVKWYMCGPTVYDTAHIGHASCYIRFDIIRRILQEYYDIFPVVAIGVTDVSDEISKRSKATQLFRWQIAQKYEREFFDQMKSLNILPPAVKLNVSHYLNEIIEFVCVLLDKKAAYKGSDGSIYFRTKADENYGRFKTPEEEISDMSFERQHSNDFALWKRKLGSGDIKSPFGNGMPGWHIECSAMASHVFGQTIDLHSGGSDLIFPHHENEEAQSTCYHGCQQWVNYWLHAGLLQIRDTKMSKSLSNFIPINTFLKTNCADHLRMLCLISHYRKGLNFDDSTLGNAIATYDKIINFHDTCELYVRGQLTTGNIREAELLQALEETKEKVKKHLADDFATAPALHSLENLIRTAFGMLNEKIESNVGRSPAAVASVNIYVKKFFESLGFTMDEIRLKNEAVSGFEAVIDTAVNFRTQIRAAALSMNGGVSDILELCDDTRDRLSKVGVQINDVGPTLARWTFKQPKNESRSTLKNVIDIIVHFRSEILLCSPKSVAKRTELQDICRATQLHLVTLGIHIRDMANGKSYWSFPKPDPENERKLEDIVDSALSFCNEIRLFASSIQERNIQQEILALCNSLVCDLDRHGIIVDDKDKSSLKWSLKKDDVGTSILEIIIEIAVHHLVQVRDLSFLCTEDNVERKLNDGCNELHKFLNTLGVKVKENTGSDKIATWSLTYSKFQEKKSIIKHLINAIIQFQIRIENIADSCEDRPMGTTLSSICDSMLKDLSSVGVVLNRSSNAASNWSYKSCGADVSCY